MEIATICKCCERDVSRNDTRFGICWDCAESESIIANGEDMYDKKIEKSEDLEDHSYGVIQKKKK